MILKLLIVFCSFIFALCTKQNVSEVNCECDYFLRVYTDVIIPPSGTQNGWITIIGGDHKGQYYVSPHGNDNNPGTIDLPFKTISYAVNMLNPGDTLVVMSGDPLRNPRPVIAGQNDLISAFDISNCQYLRIENLEITSNNKRRFREAITGTGGPVADIVLKDLYIHHIDEYAIDIADANDLQIINCRINYCGFGCIGGPAGQQGGLRNVFIKGCDLSYSGHYYQGGDGSNRPYDRPDGFGIEESEGPIEICNTIASHNYGDGLDSKAKRTYIHECIVANNSCDGVKLWGDSSRVENTLIYGRGDGNSTITPWSPIVISTQNNNAYFEIINCTVDDTVGGNYIMHVQYDDQQIPVNLKIVNSIFCSRGSNAPIIWLADNVNYDITYNLFYATNDNRLLIKGNNTYTSSEIDQIGTGNIYGNPLFVSTAWGSNGNYHIAPNSPAIDKGTSTFTLQIDLEQILRPQGPGIDIGCYEQ